MLREGRRGSHDTLFVSWVLRPSVIISDRVTPAPAADVGPNLLCYRESSACRGSSRGGGICPGGGCSGGIAAQIAIPALRVRAHAGPLARANLDDLPPHDFAGDSRHQMDFSGVVESGAKRFRFGMAASVLGSLRAPREGVARPPYLHALQSGTQRVGDEAGGVAVVELQ